MSPQLVKTSGAGVGLRQKSSLNRNSVERGNRRMGYAFVSGYVALLLAFGVIPTAYALFLSVTRNGAFVGFDNFARVTDDFRFFPAVQAVGGFLLVWLVTQTVLVVLAALLVHSIGIRWISSSLRFLYYLPGALAGVASILLWLFMLNPSVSPLAGFYSLLGFEDVYGVIAVQNLPMVFTAMAFWAGAGGWIIIMYGALNNISSDIMEAARIDGAGPVKTARFIQIPMLRKWIVYMAVLSIAAGTQLFVEPRLLAGVSGGAISAEYALNQLAFWYAFKQGDFSGAAAIAVILLLLSGALAAWFVTKGGLFERD